MFPDTKMLVNARRNKMVTTNSDKNSPVMVSLHTRGFGQYGGSTVGLLQDEDICAGVVPPKKYKLFFQCSAI